MDIKDEPIPLGVEAFQVGDAVVNISGGDEGFRDQLEPHPEQDDLIENLPIDRAEIELPTPALAEGGGIGNIVCQAVAEIPAIGHVDLEIPDQLPFAANAPSKSILNRTTGSTSGRPLSAQ